MKRLALMFAVLAGLPVVWQAPALAHNSLVEAAPAKEERTAQPPTEVKLRFLANLDKTASLEVAGPSANSAIGPVTIDGKFMSAPFTATAPGTYTVTYGVTSSDGHVIKNSYTFTIGAPTSSASLSPALAAPETKPAAQQTPWVPYIGGAAVAGLVVGGLIAFLKRRREGGG